MKIVIFTYDRFRSATTIPQAAKSGLGYTVLCHAEEQRNNFIALGGVDPAKIVATGKPRGIAFNRNWAFDNLMADGEWALFLVDDWKRCTELDTYDQETEPVLPLTMADNNLYRRKFNTEIDLRQLHHRAEQMTAELDRVGCDLGGFVAHDNPLFCKKHYTRNVLADGRAWVVRKTALRVDENIRIIDDYCFSAQQILFGRGTLVNQWVRPDCYRYSEGAYGSIQKRLPDKLADCAYLVATYPAAVRIAEKKNEPAGSHVAIRPKRA